MQRSAFPAPPAPTRPRRARRALLWGMLVLLLLVAQTLLVTLTLRYEASRAQDEVDAAAAEAAGEIRHDMMSAVQNLQTLAWAGPSRQAARDAATVLVRARRDLRRIEWRDVEGTVTDAIDTPYPPALFGRLSRKDLSVEAELACGAARRSAAPTFSRSYFVPLANGQGIEIIDLCLPLQQGSSGAEFVVGSFSLAQLLEGALAASVLRRHELSFVEGDGTRLARGGAARGAGVYVARRVVDLPGTSLQLQVDSKASRPSLIPNLNLALVLGLSMTLFAVVLLLARDVRRRAEAESALAEALAFRKAMEDSLSTGLRARDLRGVITYVNPAFCAMVGFSADELRTPPPPAALAAMPPYLPAHLPPYWPPESAADYLQRQSQRLQDAERQTAVARGGPQEGFETVFMRKNGERFPVMVYEAPLVDGQGRHTGWMSAVVDLSAQRRVEEISRQQLDRLQATARLATVGEMASLLSHELNQPLAAIASYASGSLNLLADGDAEAPTLLRQALERIAEQAERAGRVIRSVHGFVRRREQLHESLPAERLFEGVMPLARMQARKSGTRIDIDLPPVSAAVPRVRCDRTMVEQVLLNLARNGIQAMEQDTPLAERVLTLRVRQTDARWVSIAVVDAGPGIPPDVARQLFTPFFTTRSEGMGLGLSLCRTVIEQHGGTLDFGPGDGGRGTEFRFTLPAPPPAPDAAGGDTAKASRAARH